jgi:hypothetical protein
VTDEFRDNIHSGLLLGHCDMPANGRRRIIGFRQGGAQSDSAGNQDLFLPGSVFRGGNFPVVEVEATGETGMFRPVLGFKRQSPGGSE